MTDGEAWRLGRRLLLRAAAILGATLAALVAADMAQQPTVLAALIAVGGVMLTAITSLTLSRRQEELRERETREAQTARLRRTAAALRTELNFSLSTLRASFDPRHYGERLSGYVATMERADPGDGGMPLGVATEEAVLFALHKADLPDLPPALTEALVEHHQLDRALAQVISSFNAGRFDSAAFDRRKRALAYYHLLGEAALRAALAARATMDAYVAGASEVSMAASVEKHLTQDEAALYDLLSDRDARHAWIMRAFNLAAPRSDERKDGP